LYPCAISRIKVMSLGLLFELRPSADAYGVFS